MGVFDIGLLSLLIWLPVLGGLLVLALGRGEGASAGAGRVAALAISILTFVISIPLWTGFSLATADMQFVERAPWIATFNVEYYLGVDGFSMPLILLTTFLTPIVVIAGWNVIQDRPNQYFAAFLIL